MAQPKMRGLGLGIMAPSMVPASGKKGPIPKAIQVVVSVFTTDVPLH